jgi:hypothetical protein
MAVVVTLFPDTTSHVVNRVETELTKGSFDP